MKRLMYILAKRLMRIVAIMFLVLVFIYLLIIIDTYSIRRDAMRVFHAEIDIENEDYGALIRYYPKVKDIENTETKAIIIPLISYHNFSEGYVWVTYIAESKDKTTGEVLYGTYGAFSQWMIERKDHRWIVTEINEAP